MVILHRVAPKTPYTIATAVVGLLFLTRTPTGEIDLRGATNPEPGVIVTSPAIAPEQKDTVLHFLRAR